MFNYDGDLEDDMQDLVSAEDFLQFFDIEYEPSVVHVNRLHILQRFHNYLKEIKSFPEDETARKEIYAGYLTQAYQDFVSSNAITEKVFKVLQDAAKPSGFVPLDLVSK
jgi:nitrogenase-stabilizing/protective protein